MRLSSAPEVVAVPLFSCAERLLVDILGHDLLPGSGFSQKEHGSVALRRTCGLPQNAHHGGTFGNHLSAVVPIAAYSCSNGVDGLGVAVFLVHGINLDLAGDGVYNFTLRVENRGHCKALAAQRLT